jgi:hypothetical protein
MTRFLLFKTACGFAGVYLCGQSTGKITSCPLDYYVLQDRWKNTSAELNPLTDRTLSLD